MTDTTPVQNNLEDRVVTGYRNDRIAAPMLIERTQRRVRVFFAGAPVADSVHVKLVLEENHLPVYYFPEDDVRMDLLRPTDKQTRCPLKGEASYWTITVGQKSSKDAAWSYREPVPGAEQIGGHIAFYWNRVDAWFEEDDEVYVHPRDPYHRVDVLQSSRHVRVEAAGEVLAETVRPRLLFETHLPVRYYIPKLDIRIDLLEPSSTRTRCPYKGEARYWSVRVGGRVLDDLAWSYQEPIPECPKIENLVCFFNERVDTYVDGNKIEVPQTPWSR